MAASVVKEISDKSRKLQRELLVVFREADLFLQRRLDDDVKSEIEKDISELNKFCRKLESSHCPILVAGETSAGKSSLLNLLLGEDVLPQKLLSSTHVICELKWDSRKHVVVHSRDGDCDDDFDLLGDEANQKKQLSEYIRNKDSKYKKVEIFWPSPILHEGIFLVDSPGVGDDSQLDSITLDYLSQACAFIYVINTANAGGVQPGGVLRIIREFVRENPGFHPKSAIFIFNKWDLVPESEEEEVKEQMIQRLQEDWPDLDPSFQVFYLSARQAAECQKSDEGPTEDFTKLLEGIRCLVPEGLVSKLKISYGFLENLLQRTHDNLQAQLAAAEEEVDKMTSQIQSVRQRLDNVQERLTDSLQTLEIGPEKCFDDIVRRLYDDLKLDTVETELQSWVTSDIATVSSFEDIQPTIIKHVERRISDVVSEWKKNSGDVQRVYEEIRTFKMIIEDEEIIQTAVDDAPPVEQSRPEAEEDRALPQTSHEERPLLGTETVLDLATAPAWIFNTLAAAVIFPPIMGLCAAKTSIEQREHINRFNAEPAVYLSDCAREFLKKVTPETVREFLSEEPNTLKMHMELKSALVSIKQKNEKSLEDLSHEVQSKSAIIQEFRPEVNECQTLISKLQLFHVHHLETRDIVLEDILDWDRSMTIGTGSFADIFKAKLKIRRDNSVIPVALKVMRNPLSEINVSDVVTEGKVLRSLEHGNILKLIGCYLHTNPHGDSRYVLVTELCTGNLRGYVRENSANIPGKLERYSSEQGAAMKHVTGIAIQLLEGLTYIHDKGFLHRDLKMENILVSNGDVLKLGDVGLSKAEDEVTGTQCGTLLYAAPEVYSGSRRKYTRKADIFSFGLMLWELWYGDVIFKGAPQPLEFIKEVAAGKRPPFPTGAEPIYFWRDLMQQCWDGEPGKRPPAEQCLYGLQTNNVCSSSIHFNIDTLLHAPCK